MTLTPDQIAEYKRLKAQREKRNAYMREYMRAQYRKRRGASEPTTPTDSNDPK